MTDRDFMGVTALTAWEAAWKCYEATGKTDLPGTTYKVTGEDGKLSKFKVTFAGEVVPADLFPVM